MTKNRWKVIMPKRGTLKIVLDHVHKHIEESLGVVITKEQLIHLEQIHSRISSLNLAEEAVIRFPVFRPKSYQAAFTVTLPHTRVHERSDDNLYKAYDGPKRGSAGSARQMAKDMICKQVLESVLGKQDYEEESKKFMSNSDFLYNYCHHQKLPRPGILSVITRPRKYSGLVSSVLIPESGLVALTGFRQVTYGAAVESAAVLLDRIITDLRIAQHLADKGGLPLSNEE